MPFLEALKEQFGGERDVIVPCIRDLAQHGLRTERFSEGESRPNRQQVAEYLAAWCRMAGIPYASCVEWLREYSVAKLSPISRSSASAIRHSASSTVSCIFRLEVPFTCGCEDNLFRADCSPACPHYAEMKARPREDWRAACRLAPPAAVECIEPVKKRYAEQFQKALEIIRDELARGSTYGIIVKRLDSEGLRSRTGRTWNISTLEREIRKMRETPGGDHAGAPTPAGACGAADDRTAAGAGAQERLQSGSGNDPQ